MCSLALERLGDDPKHKGRRRKLVDLRLHLEAQTKCPVSNMPVELLLEIFALSRRPVVLSQVCRQWREVAFSQPTLWRSLVLKGPAKNALRKIREWHKRSGGRIVGLSIHRSLAATLYPSAVDTRLPDDHVLCAYVLDALQKLDMTELQECHIEDMNAELFLIALSGGHSVGFIHQYLNTLSISHSSRHSVVFGHADLAILPWKNLRALSITSQRCNWAALSTSMRHLTSFEYRIHHGSFAHFRHIHLFFKANPGLEKLVFEAITDPNHFEPQESLIMPHLRHLELNGITPFRFKRGNFSLPSLRILRMNWLQNAAPTLSELITDEETSFAELVELTARGCTLGPLLTSTLLRAPKLEILNCTSDDLDACIIAQSLTRPCMGLLRDRASEDRKVVHIKLPILCPSLSVLDLSGSPSLKTGTVMRIVEERIALAASEDGRYRLPGENGNRVVSCIRDLKVDECPLIEAEMHPWFQKNVPQFSCRYELSQRRWWLR